MMHPDHFDAIRIMVFAGITAVIGERIAKTAFHFWQHVQ